VRSEPVLDGTDRNGRGLNMLNYLDTPRNVNRTYDEWYDKDGKSAYLLLG
jgi:hypothetical protein